jgi:hypothetical protein
MLLAASALAQPVIAATVLVARTVAANLSPGEGRSRLALSGTLALLLAAPGLWPLVRSLSPREAEAILLSVHPRELLPFALGLVLAAFAPLLFLRLAEPRSRAGRLVTAALATVATVLLVARVHGWIASGQLPPPARAALLRVAAETDSLQVVCAPEGARDWVPALAGRAAGEPGPWIPPVYEDEWALRGRRPCDVRLDTFLPGQ